MQRPLVTFDLDGVICRPPLGINPGRGQHKKRTGEGTKSLLWRTERWRYLGRKPMDGAAEGLRNVAAEFDWAVVSARSSDAEAFTRAWFEKQIGVTPRLLLRPDWREKPAQFKIRTIGQLQPIAHFEDDPHTAQWVAELVPAVFLVDWWRNRWLSGPNVHRIHRIDDALPILREVAGRATG